MGIKSNLKETTEVYLCRIKQPQENPPVNLFFFPV